MVSWYSQAQLHDLVPPSCAGAAGGSRMGRAPPGLVTYDQAHCVKTMTLLPAKGRNAMWMAAHASQAINPLNRIRPDSRTAKLRPITAIFPLSKYRNGCGGAWLVTRPAM